jgi:molecular chaperone HtpG
LRARRKKRKEKKKKKVPAVEHQWELVNKNKEIWTCPQSEVTDGEYGEFYKVLINDWEKHLAMKRFRTEGGFGFTVILFILKRVLYDLFESKKKFKKSNFMFDVFLS